MSNIIAVQFTDELDDWNRQMTFKEQESVGFGAKLAEVIHRNSIPNIAAKVEVHQAKFNKLMMKFNLIRMHILDQKSMLKTSSGYIEDTMVDNGINKKQKDLKYNMQLIEEEYNNVKYACSEFLFETLKK